MCCPKCLRVCFQDGGFMNNNESRKQRTIRKAKDRRQLEDDVKDIQFYSQFVPNEALNISEEISDWLNNDNNW